MNLNNSYMKSFEEIIGLDLIFENNQIKTTNLPLVISRIFPESIKDLIIPMENLIQEMSLKESPLEPLFLKKILIIKYIFNLINPQADFSVLDEFIEKLQILSNKTYEQDSCRMGFIIFQNPKDNIEDELNKLNIDYIPFHESISIENLDKIKLSLKIVDSLSISYIVDSSYKIIGLGKKRKSKQSISSIMTNRYQKENEAMLKFNMLKYFINQYSIDDLERKQINKIELSINSLKEELSKMEIQRNMVEKKYLNKGDSLTNEPSENESMEYLEKKHLLLVKISELQDRQIELLEKYTSRYTMWNNGLKRYLAEKTTKNISNIQFVQLDSNKIEWFINDSIICSLSNGKWNVKNYELISHIILEFMLRQHIHQEVITSEKFIDLIDKIIPRFHILFNNLKELSKKNIGALIILLCQSNKQNRTVFKNLLNKGKLDFNEYKNIIKTENNNPLNIYSCDKYLFELICSVDGAVLLDRNFNIISFGEMINNSLETPPVAEAGSRTLAAAKASTYGLSIKVSEDGDISIFEDGSPIIKL